MKRQWEGSDMVMILLLPLPPSVNNPLHGKSPQMPAL